jgi:hypothetical protein
MKKSKLITARTAAELANQLGLTPADAAEIELRSALNSKIIETVRRKGLTHAQSQPLLALPAPASPPSSTATLKTSPGFQVSRVSGAVLTAPEVERCTYKS